ncbi:MAG: LysR family transcriptional regulator [Proteobacteria bacterium]|nr:LysR family transcriptional regulator [Pseudomonadota bacterium]
MPLSSAQLEAFAEVAKCGGFSVAAKNLHITQSALSQRVMNLEKELETALLVRDHHGIRLTQAGESLLRHWQTVSSLESEVLENLGVKNSQAAGMIRVATFSSIGRSIVLPALAKVVERYPDMNLQLLSKEIRDLLPSLSKNEVDFIFTTESTNRSDIESHLVGYEENVLVESTSKKARNDVYLDHDSEDQTTFKFFSIQKKKMPKMLQRSYLDEIYSLIDGVACGLGRAVIPRHLVDGRKGIREVEGLNPLRLPVYFQYFKQPYYTKSHNAIVTQLQIDIPKYLMSEI